jgi:MFS family permease
MVSLAPSPSILQSVQRRTIRTLVVAQVLGAVGLAAGGTAGALLAQDLTGDTAAAGLPLALVVLGSGIGAVVVTRIMNLAGRRAGLTTAHLCGAAGASLSVAAAGLRDWPLLLGGCTLLGCGNAAVMLARYAAADLAGGRRGRSISTVVTAASVGAVAGPNLLGPLGGVARGLGLPDATGLFLLAIPAFLDAALVLTVFLRPDPLLVARTGTSAGAPVVAITAVLAHANVRLALLVLATSNLTMVAIMAVAPVQMHAHGAGLGMVGLMISAHIGAMYLPSPITGALADRLGARRVTSGAALVLVVAGTVALVAGSGLVGTVIVLLLLGIGWNAGLIGGSALLREAPIGQSQQTWAEGLGELGMGAAAAVGGGSAGLVLGAGGFAVLCLVAAVPCVLLLVLIATNPVAVEAAVEGET